MYDYEDYYKDPSEVDALFEEYSDKLKSMLKNEIVAIMFEVIFCLASFILFLFVGSLMDDDDHLRKFEDLYELTDAGKVQ